MAIQPYNVRRRQLLCPVCSSMQNVNIVESIYGICSKCQRAWVLSDYQKRSWVCPEDGMRLDAYEYRKGRQSEIKLFCPLCHEHYVIPEATSLKSKLSRAFVVEEEIE